MNILHVIPSVSERSGGPAQAIFPMCRALQAEGIDVTIATTDHGIVSSSEFQVSSSSAETRNVKLETRKLFKGVPTLFFAAQFGDSFKYSRPLATWLDANVKSFDVVHIHAVFNHACVAAARACRKHEVPYIVRPLGTLDPWSMKQKSLKKSLFWQLAAKRMLRDAAAVHYTARAEKTAAEESLGLANGKVVPLGIDADLAASSLDRSAFARMFPELTDHPYVLVLSRLHPKKALDVLIDGFVSATQEIELGDWRLVLAGEGPAAHVDALKAQISDRHAEGIVIFPGWLEGEKKSAVLRNASILALPSYQENFGVCVMEAMACGVPVLVSPHVNLAEDIEAAHAGWIVQVQSDAIAKALVEAITDPDERSKRGDAGRLLSRDFRWDKIALDLANMYSSVSPAPEASLSTVY